MMSLCHSLGHASTAGRAASRLDLKLHLDEDAVGKEEYEDEFVLGVGRPKFTRPEG
jgi:hypothetical protein